MSSVPYFETPTITLVAPQPAAWDERVVAARSGREIEIDAHREALQSGASQQTLVISIRCVPESQPATGGDVDEGNEATKLTVSGEAIFALDRFLTVLRGKALSEFEVERRVADLKPHPAVTGDDRLLFPRLSIYRRRREVFIDGVEQPLTKSEFDLLVELASQPGVVFSRRQIVLAYKGPDYPVDDRSIDVQVFNLRRKLGPVGRYLQTVRGVGYRFSTNHASL